MKPLCKSLLSLACLVVLVLALLQWLILQLSPYIPYPVRCEGGRDGA